MEYANPDSLLAQFRSQDLPEDAVLRLLRGFTAYADVFRTAGDRVREKQP
jgi:hypothetical protein